MRNKRISAIPSSQANSDGGVLALDSNSSHVKINLPVIRIGASHKHFHFVAYLIGLAAPFPFHYVALDVALIFLRKAHQLSLLVHSSNVFLIAPKWVNLELLPPFPPCFLWRSLRHFLQHLLQHLLPLNLMQA